MRVYIYVAPYSYYMLQYVERLKFGYTGIVIFEGKLRTMYSIHSSARWFTVATISRQNCTWAALPACKFRFTEIDVTGFNALQV